MRAYEFIAEALTATQKQKLFRDLGAGYDKNIHSNVFNGKSRIYVPFEDSTSQSQIQPRVQEYIRGLGYDIADYSAGIALKISDPSRKIRIGKLVKDQLLQQFANDPARAAAKQKSLSVVFSRDPEDIAGMSTNRGWVSCMDLADGKNKKYVPVEIKNGALIAYLIQSDDVEIDHPLARILLKPYYYKNHIILHPSQVYGTAPAEFSTYVSKFCRWANSGSPAGSYKLAKGSYNDFDDEQVTHYTDVSHLSSMTSAEKRQILRGTLIPNDIMTALAQDKDDQVRMRVAQSKQISPELCKELSKDPSVDVRASVAGNARAQSDVLTSLSKDSEVDVRQNVAWNASTPADVLTALAKDEDQTVRGNIAWNSSSPQHALALLANDSSLRVLEGLANHESTPPEILSKLATHSQEYVRRLVAKNKSTPQETLEKLASDREEDVLEAVAENEATPPNTLEKLSTEWSIYIRRKVATNHATPPKVLAKLARTEYQIKYWVLDNPALPREAVELLVNDEDEDISEKAQQILKGTP